MFPKKTFLKPGDSHPDFPHWKVEQVHHSPSHMDLVKFQWVRRDGVRGTLMGWLGQFADKRPYIDDQGGSNIGAEFDIKVKDKNVPMGEPDETLMTVRWHSWDAAKSWPPVDGAEPMVWED